MNALISLYDALVSINVPADKAKAVVEAMERDASFLLATTGDIALLRRDLDAARGEPKAEFALVRQEFALLRQELGAAIAANKADIALLRRDLDAAREETKAEFALVRQEFGAAIQATKADIALVQRSVDTMGDLFRRDMAKLESALTIRLGSMLVVGLGVMLTALRALQH